LDFDKETGRKVIDATGAPLKDADPEALAADLQEAVDDYRLWISVFETAYTEKQRRDILQSIEKKAEGLLSALEAEDGDVPPHLETVLERQARLHAENSGGFPERPKTTGVSKDPETGEEIPIVFYHTHAAIRDAVEGVRRLGIWAKTGREEMDSPDWEQWEAEGSTAEGRLIGKGLPGVYNKHANKAFGISNPPDGEGVSYGPGVRFIQTCLDALKISKKPNAIARQYRRYKEQWDIAEEK